MSSFEYVMVLVSIVIALAIAHLLTALSECVRRFRGKGEPIKLDAVFLLWVGDILIWLISFWWWEFKYQEVVAAWSFGLYLFVIGYAISLFMLVEILVPHRMKGVTDTYADFKGGRKWFFGMLLLVQAIDVVDTYLKGFEWVARRTRFLVEPDSFLPVKAQCSEPPITTLETSACGRKRSLGR